MQHLKIFCLFFVLSVFLSACTQKPQLTITPTPTVEVTSSPAVTVQPTVNTTNFTVFKNAQLSFSYPKEITVSDEKGSILLHHAIAHEHQDACDFKGEGVLLKELTDFHMTFEVSEVNLKGTLEKRNETFLVDQLQGNGLVIEKGFIDPVEVGAYKGFEVHSGVEGCGNITYYVPVSEKKTIVIQRALVPELAPISADAEKNKQLPGVIQPVQEEAWVQSILKSVKVL
jgi:hypothetical protein